MWARDAQSAEAWLFAQEQYLRSEDYGVSFSPRTVNCNDSIISLFMKGQSF